MSAGQPTPVDTMTPRVAPGTRSEIGTINAIISSIGGRVSGTESPKLFLTLGRHRRLFRAWLRFGGAMMPGGRLARRPTEMVIVRVASTRSCDYELTHHLHMAKRAKVTSAQLDRLVDSRAFSVAHPIEHGWSASEQTLLAATDELLATDDLTDATWRALCQHFDEKQRIELVMLVGHYTMLATFIGTLRIEPDERR